MSENNEVRELALKFMESEEMRECFRNALFSEKKTTRADSNVCQDIIIGSRSNIEDKLAALKKLPPDKETLNLISAAETALAEVKNSNGNVFLATLHFPYYTEDFETLEDRKPFLSFESVMSYIQRETARQCEVFEESLELCKERIWYEVEKFVPDDSSELLHKITWTLNAKGEIMFFELGEDFKEEFNFPDEDYVWNTWFHWSGSGFWEYPPVPFDFGDIITIDMRPFYEAFHGVIVRLGDNRDGCAVACIYCDEDGNLYCSTLKHNMHKDLSKISPLYRAETYAGELPENEQALKMISAAVKKIPSVNADKNDEYVWREHKIADQFDEFLCRGNYKKQKGAFGCSWAVFQDKFKI